VPGPCPGAATVSMVRSWVIILSRSEQVDRETQSPHSLPGMIIGLQPCLPASGLDV
jgi:hypothetical protein